jgi:hypothetical protein
VCGELRKKIISINFFLGGVGGSGGVGGREGGDGGTGEGPKMYYDVKTPHFTVNNLYGINSYDCFPAQQ